MIAILAIAAAILAGYLAGGSLKNLGRAPIRGASAVLVLFAVQAALRGRLLFTDEVAAWSLVGWFLATLALIGLILWNAGLPGVTLIASGLLLNVLAVAFNGGMPVDYMAAQRSAGRGELPVLPEFYVYSRGSAPLHYLGDVLPLRVGESLLLVSVGDLMLLAGAMWLVFALMRRRPAADD
jgi:hypothetical protein